MQAESDDAYRGRAEIVSSDSDGQDWSLHFLPALFKQAGA